jgi:hypothetical protein
MKKWVTLTMVMGAALALFVSPLRAIGDEERGKVHALGGCTMKSTWELVMEPEVGIKFEATIETGVPDQDWDITLKYENVVLIHEIEQTEEDGGFEVVKVENNKKGEDSATVVATNLETGERCFGKLRAGL